MQYITFEQEAGLAVLTINRPQVLNALNAGTMREIDEVLRDLAVDRSVRVLIITGAGEKAFVAGADLNELKDLNAAQARRNLEYGQQILRRLERLETVSIAAINGYALGGGCELALACSLRIASDHAQIGLPEVGLGMIPGYGATQRLPRLIGTGRALELILTGKRISAAEAQAMGLVNAVVPQAKLMNTAREWAASILGKGPEAVRIALRAVHEGIAMPLDEALAYEIALDTYLFTTGDRAEGTLAFLEKRRPEFQDC